MRKIKLIIAAMALLLASCAVTTPNKPASGEAIPLAPMHIKKMAPVAYEYKAANIGCTEIEFLKKFVGKKIKLEDGSVLHVDNILDIHTDQHSSQRWFDIWIKFSVTNENFICSFWGLAVEYENSPMAPPPPPQMTPQAQQPTQVQTQTQAPDSVATVLPAATSEPTEQPQQDADLMQQQLEQEPTAAPHDAASAP